MLYEFRGKCKKEHPPTTCAQEIFLSVRGQIDCKLNKEEFIEGIFFIKKKSFKISIFTLYFFLNFRMLVK